MHVGVPFPLKIKSLLVTAGILILLLAVLNLLTWYYRLYPSLGSLAAGLAGIPLNIGWGTLNEYAFWVENIIVSAALLFIGLVIAYARASATARRIVRMVDTVEGFEDGHFDSPPCAGRGKIGALEESIARLGDSLALMLKFINKDAACLAKDTHFSLSAESPSVTLVVFKIDNYHALARHTGPKQINILVNDFLARITPCITKTGGVINKIWTINDFYALAVWNPLTFTPNVKKYAAGAFRACVLVRSAVKTMNRDRRILAGRSGNRACFPLNVSVSMGVDSGEAFAGPVGAHKRKEYDILGSAVHNAVFCACLAARTTHKIVITERTLALCEGRFITRKLPGKNTAFFSLVKPQIGQTRSRS